MGGARCVNAHSGTTGHRGSIPGLAPSGGVKVDQTKDQAMDKNTVGLPKPASASSLHGAGGQSLSPADGGPVPLSLDEAEKVGGGCPITGTGTTAVWTDKFCLPSIREN